MSPTKLSDIAISTIFHRHSTSKLRFGLKMHRWILQSLLFRNSLRHISACLRAFDNNVVQTQRSDALQRSVRAFLHKKQCISVRYPHDEKHRLDAQILTPNTLPTSSPSLLPQLCAVSRPAQRSGALPSCVLMITRLTL